MSRRGWAIVGGLVVAVVLAVVLWPSSHPELDPDRAERVTLYSIDFRSAAPVFNKLLEDAKVPVVPPGCP